MVVFSDVLSFELLRFLAMVEETPVKIGVLVLWRCLVNSMASSMHSFWLLNNSFASLFTTVSGSFCTSCYFQL